MKLPVRKHVLGYYYEMVPKITPECVSRPQADFTGTLSNTNVSVCRAGYEWIILLFVFRLLIRTKWIVCKESTTHEVEKGD